MAQGHTAETVEALTKQINKAAEALTKYHVRTSKSLVTDDDFVWLSIVNWVSTARPKTWRPRPIRLPNPLYSENDTCFIVKSDQSYVKVFDEIGFHFGQVLPISQLRREYQEPDAKRKLFHSYDLFLADQRISHLLPRALGKQFLVQKKDPLLVHFSTNQQVLSKTIKNKLKSTLVFSSTGTVSAFKIARVSFTAEQITANIIAALKNIHLFVRGGWKNIRQLGVKTDVAPTLPFYAWVPTSPADIDWPHPKKKAPVGKESISASHTREVQLPKWPSSTKEPSRKRTSPKPSGLQSSPAQPDKKKTASKNSPGRKLVFKAPENNTTQVPKETTKEPAKETMKEEPKETPQEKPNEVTQETLPEKVTSAPAVSSSNTQTPIETPTITKPQEVDSDGEVEIVGAESSGDSEVELVDKEPDSDEEL
ncbi:ribosomal protein L1 [Pelomyxa schiedti]|nr:ribosomal protein L1 [Pelomyxa schiedti]